MANSSISGLLQSVNGSGGLGLAESANATSLALPGSEFGWSGYFQAIGAIFLLLALLVFGFYILKRVGIKAGVGIFNKGDLKLEGQLALGPRRSIAVVRFLNKRLVLGVTETNINLLSETELENDAEQTASFAESLKQASNSNSDT